MSKKHILWITVAALLVSLCVGAQQTVVVDGAAAILNKDSAQARDKAVESALRAAVEQVIGTMVDSESLVKNNELLYDKIYTQTSGYVTDYKILSEDADLDTNLYRVKVEASVKKGNLEQDLQSMGLLMRRMKMPRVAVALKEDREDASAVLMKLLKEKGFHVVASPDSIRDKNFWSDFWNNDLEYQTNLLKKHGAEVVILGEASGNRGGRVGNSDMVSYQAGVTLKAFKSDTREMLASSTGSGKAVHVGEEGMRQALRQAAQIGGRDLVRQITSQWAKEASSTRMVTLEILKCSPDQASSVAARLQDEGRGIQDAYVRSVQGGVALIEVSMEGDVGDLAQELKKLYPKFAQKAQTANQLTVSR